MIERRLTRRLTLQPPLPARSPPRVTPRLTRPRPHASKSELLPLATSLLATRSPPPRGRTNPNRLLGLHDLSCQPFPPSQSCESWEILSILSAVPVLGGVPIQTGSWACTIHPVSRSLYPGPVNPVKILSILSAVPVLGGVPIQTGSWACRIHPVSRSLYPSPVNPGRSCQSCQLSPYPGALPLSPLENHLLGGLQPPPWWLQTTSS